MRNIWILERFVTVEEIEKTIEDILGYIEDTDNENEKRAWEQALNKCYERRIAGGYWLGYVACKNYKSFCFEAKDFMRRHKNDLLLSGVRAIKGQLSDTDKYWTRYKDYPHEIKEGVTRFLYATYR